MQVIVYVPPTTVPQSAPGQAQLLPAAVPSTDGGGRQPNVADGEAEAPADAVQLFARSDHAPPLGVPPNHGHQEQPAPDCVYSGCTYIVRRC